jgi:hypothetical protein
VCERVPDTAQTELRPVAAAPAAPAADAAYAPIEEIQLGQRLLGANPLADDVELDEPGPACARTVVLEARKPDGNLVHAELIWPLELIEETGAAVGGEIGITFGEIETTGTARVVAIGPCPELEPGPGTLVIGRYRHDVADVPMVQLTLDDGSESVDVTANHPYWSVDPVHPVDPVSSPAHRQEDEMNGMNRMARGGVDSGASARFVPHGRDVGR